MAFKFIILALTLAYANAGYLTQPAAIQYSAAPAVSNSYFQQSSAPVAYTKAYAPPAVAVHSASALAVHSAPAALAVHTAPVQAPSVGISQQTVSRSLGGAQSVSTYSKAVDSAFSSVRKYDTRITNDALSYAPAQVAYSAPLVTKAYAAPVYSAPAPVAYAAPAQVVTKAYGAPAPVVSYAVPAPVLTKTYAAPAPVLSYGAPAPVLTKTYGAPAPVFSYGAPAQLVAKSYAAPAPVVSYAAPTAYAAHGAYAAPTAYAAPAPVVAKAIAPVATYGAAAPVVTKAAVAYSPAAVVAHTAFQGYGVEYHY